MSAQFLFFDFFRSRNKLQKPKNASHWKHVFVETKSLNQALGISKDSTQLFACYNLPVILMLPLSSLKVLQKCKFADRGIPLKLDITAILQRNER